MVESLAATKAASMAEMTAAWSADPWAVNLVVHSAVWLAEWTAALTVAEMVDLRGAKLAAELERSSAARLAVAWADWKAYASEKMSVAAKAVTWAAGLADWLDDQSKFSMGAMLERYLAVPWVARRADGLAVCSAVTTAAWKAGRSAGGLVGCLAGRKVAWRAAPMVVAWAQSLVGQTVAEKAGRWVACSADYSVSQLVATKVVSRAGVRACWTVALSDALTVGRSVRRWAAHLGVSSAVA
jgi:hypothetical protein